MLHKFSYRIYYEDTDAGGVVYYANYLKFFERARTDFLRELGIDQSQLLQQENTCFVVKKCEIDYLSPAKLDDLITVDVQIEKMTATSIIMHQKVTKDASLLSQLKVSIVCVNASNFRPSRISNNIKNLLNGDS